MSKWRRRGVQAFIVLLIFGNVRSIFFGGDDWPFSSYSMFSAPETPQPVQALRVVGVRADGTETPLWGGCSMPHGSYRLRYALERAYGLPDGPNRLRSLFRACLSSKQIPFQSIRLYRFYWKLTPALAHDRNPSEKELLLEVKSS
jgi:hypothetical protein